MYIIQEKEILVKQLFVELKTIILFLTLETRSVLKHTVSPTFSCKGVKILSVLK